MQWYMQKAGEGRVQV